MATPEIPRRPRGLATAAKLIAGLPLGGLADRRGRRALLPRLAPAGGPGLVQLLLARQRLPLPRLLRPALPEAAAALQAALGDRRRGDRRPRPGAPGGSTTASRTSAAPECATATARRVQQHLYERVHGAPQRRRAARRVQRRALLRQRQEHLLQHPVLGQAWGEYDFPAYDMIGISSWSETYDNVIHTDSCCPVKRDVIGRGPGRGRRSGLLLRHGEQGPVQHPGDGDQRLLLRRSRAAPAA